jgi:hypothetical protein
LDDKRASRELKAYRIGIMIVKWFEREIFLARLLTSPFGAQLQPPEPDAQQARIDEAIGRENGGLGADRMFSL